MMQHRLKLQANCRSEKLLKVSLVQLSDMGRTRPTGNLEIKRTLTIKIDKPDSYNSMQQSRLETYLQSIRLQQLWHSRLVVSTL